MWVVDWLLLGSGPLGEDHGSECWAWLPAWHTSGIDWEGYVLDYHP